VCRLVAGSLTDASTAPTTTPLLLPAGAYLRATVAFTDKIYVKNHRQLASQLETNIPKGAFAGATLDMLFTGDGLSKLDSTTQDRILDFAEDFLDCDCQANPTAAARRKFMRYVLELRAEGLGRRRSWT